MRFFLVGLVALSIAGTATAAPAVEPGFRQSKPLTVRAAKIAPGAKVFCARGMNAWTAFVARTNPNGTGHPTGATFIETREIYLAPFVCWPLHDRLAGRRVTDKDFALGLHAFIHESAHAKGIRDECAADRFAWQKFALVARRDFGVTSFARLRSLRAYARQSGSSYNC